VALVLAAAPVAPALAAGGGEKKAEDPGSQRVMEIRNLVAPVVRDGRLVNYLFLDIKIDLGDGDIWKLRDKSHFVRDAMIRAVHKTSIASAARDDKADMARAVQVLDGATKQVLGAAAVKGVTVTSVSALKVSAGAKPKA
jgi:hypothetical protein